MKLCSRCGESRSESEFHAMRHGKVEHRKVCKPCRLVASNRWYRDNKEWAKKLHREWVSEHSTQNKEYKRKWAEDNKTRRQEKNWRRHGIICTAEQRRALLAAQAGKCAVCRRPESDFKKGLAVDHNHVTGKVRGLLCGPCNYSVIKTVEDRYYLIERAIEYLRG